MTPFGPNLKSWTTRDRSNWSSGEWDNEPDKIQWIDPITNLDCLMHRNHSGAWCGYVGLGPDHPLHGKSYWDFDVKVHGGLTFANPCANTSDESHGICHVAAEGRPPHVWWFGFDCAHLNDETPYQYGYDFGEIKIYRDLAYVKREVESLAFQLAALERSPS